MGSLSLQPGLSKCPFHHSMDQKHFFGSFWWGCEPPWASFRHNLAGKDTAFLVRNPPTPWGQGVLEQCFRVWDVLLGAQNRTSGHFDFVRRSVYPPFLACRLWLFWASKFIQKRATLKNYFFVQFWRCSWFPTLIWVHFGDPHGCPGATFWYVF